MKTSRANETVFPGAYTQENNSRPCKARMRFCVAGTGSHPSDSAPERLPREYAAPTSRRSFGACMSKLALFCVVIALTMVAASAPAQVSSRLAEGLDMHSTGRLSRAIEIYTEVIKKDPRSAEAYNWRGMAYDDLGKLDLALRDYNKAIEISKNYADVYNNRGEVYRKKRQYKKAVEDYSKAASLEDGFSEAHFNLGLVYEIQNKAGLAAKEYAEYLKLNPKAPDEMEIQLRINRLDRIARSQKPTTADTAKKQPTKPPTKMATRQPGKVVKQPSRRPPGTARKRVAQAKKTRPPKSARSGAEAIANMVDQLSKETGVRFNPKQKRAFINVFRQMAPAQRKQLLNEIRKMDPSQKKAFAQALQKMDPAQIKPMIEWVQWASQNGPMIGYASLGLYFLMALMLFLVARKTNAGLSWMAFIPILNVYLMLRVAGKPGWWLILLLIPLVNFIIGIIVAFGIAKARRKSALWGLLLIIPCTSPLAWLYLGLSR